MATFKMIKLDQLRVSKLMGFGSCCVLSHLFPFPEEDKELIDYWITVKPVTPCCFTRSVVIVTSLQQHTGGRSQFCESQFTRYAMSWKCEVCRGLECDH